jgi:hypothetical protein
MCSPLKVPWKAMAAGQDRYRHRLDGFFADDASLALPGGQTARIAVIGYMLRKR